MGRSRREREGPASPRADQERRVPEQTWQFQTAEDSQPQEVPVAGEARGPWRAEVSKGAPSFCRAHRGRSCSHFLDGVCTGPSLSVPICLWVQYLHPFL